MTLRMFDSIDVANLPDGADAYGAYVDGSWPTIIGVKARFPKAHILSIAVFPEDDAQCLDVETGDATIASVFGWFTRQQKRGVWRPAIYTSAANLDHLLATMKANGFARSSWRCWSAHYGAGEHICGPSSCGYPQADGTQFTDSAAGNRGSMVDESLLLDSFFQGVPKPPPPPPPAPKPAHFTLSGDGMFILPAGGETIALTVPVAVQLAGGGWVAPSALRLSCSSPAAFEYALGTTQPSDWQPVSLDYARSPTLVGILTATGEPYPVLKLRRTDSSPAPVTGDFA